MLTLYTGTPGSGKSYTAADRIDRALRRGMPVIANFEINVNPKKHKGEFVFVDTLQLTPEFLMDYSQKHFDPKKGQNQGLIFIDEAQIPFNPRTGFGGKGDNSRMAWINFFSKHRHYFWDVILISQHDRMIDRQIRSLIEVERKHRDLINYGVKGLYMMMIFHKRFVQVSYWYPIQEKIGSEFFGLKKRVCRLYDTFKKFENDKPDIIGADQRTDDEERKRKIAEFNKKVSDLI
ncbi:MAG: zonular occludens toxin domain-containing protein [Oscillospiraceae bacterium]